jgi:putative acetyltransferase
MAETRDLFVAKKNSTIIGVGGLEGNYVGTVFVHPEYQNQGIGRAIMEKLEAKAMEKGIEKVVLKASINAVPFYKNIGYTEIKEVHDENYGTTLKMAKKL